MVARLQTDRPGPATLPILLELLAGTGRPLGVVVVAVLAMVGVVVLARRDQLLLRLLALVIAAQVVAVVASGAVASHVPIVAARYLAVVLPFLWVFPAAGLEALARRLGLRSAQSSAPVRRSRSWPLDRSGGSTACRTTSRTTSRTRPTTCRTATSSASVRTTCRRSTGISPRAHREGHDRRGALVLLLPPVRLHAARPSPTSPDRVRRRRGPSRAKR